MTAPPTALDVFVARQPIFDVDNNCVAYELLYRSTAAATTAGGIGSDMMCNDTALHALVSIGLDRLTGGATAYVNVTREHLVGEYFRIFEPGQVVLELLETIEGDDEVLQACARAVSDGYTLALDDYDGRSALDPLLSFVRVVKLDVLGRPESELAPLVSRLRTLGITVLAERVETLAERDLCRRIGCALFQGFVFSRPETVDGRTLSVQDTAIMRILALAQDPNVTDSVLEDAFRSHPSLSHTLLRIVKSAAIGVANVTSIPHAIRVVGRASLSRWLMVMLVGSMASRNPVARETVMQALVRARFCELLSTRNGTGDPAARFLVGLLSRMDILLGQPMTEVLQRLPVTPDVQAALLDGAGPHGSVLRLAEAYEAAQWDTVDNYRASSRFSGALLDVYGQAAQWAMERLSEDK